METKTKKTFKKIDKNFKQKRPVTIYMLLSLVLIIVVLSSRSMTMFWLWIIGGIILGCILNVILDKQFDYFVN